MWVKRGEIKAGDTVFLDSGFTCVKAGPVEIQQGMRGLYFRCSAGAHYIDGQLEDGVYIGLSALPCDLTSG